MRGDPRAQQVPQAAVALLLVVALHLALVVWLGGSRGAAPRDQPPMPRITLRLLASPAPPAERIESTPARMSGAGTTRTRAARHEPAVDASAADPALRLAPEEAIVHAEPAANAPDGPPSLLDGDATRRAIRASAHAPSLSDQLARARDEPSREGAQQRLGSAVRSAGKGDCAKGEFVGAGMGLLSLPFLAAAVARGDCAP